MNGKNTTESMKPGIKNPGESVRIPSFSIVTLGCKVNQYESDKIRKELMDKGFREAGDNEPADFCVVNTCAVTGEASRKSRQALRRFRKISPGARIFAIGCAAEIPGDALGNLPDDMVFIKNEEKNELPERIAGLTGIEVPDLLPKEKHLLHGSEDGKEVFDPGESGGRTRAYLKVQDGCNSFCSYCIIPYLRGRSRSRPVMEIVEELNALEKSGFQEVVLTGIHMGDYGRGLDEKIDLAGLLEILCKNTGIPRIRLSSLEPMDFSFHLLEVMKRYPVICRHLHLPLQHGSHRILKLMNRKYSPGEYGEIVKRAVELFPEIAITTDVMVGFPGETEDDFNEMYHFIENVPFFMLHCFPYSRRPGTKADSMEGIIDASVKKKRLQKLIALGNLKMKKFLDRFINREVEVLPEKFNLDSVGKEITFSPQNRIGILQGHTDNYLSVEFPGEESLRNRILKVTVKERMGEKLYGERLTPFCNRR